MSRRAKLFQTLRSNPKDVRVADACRVAEFLGFEEKGGKGQHRVFARAGELTILNFQDRGDGKIPTYQAKQLIAMLDKHGEP
jgi:predicted RNA binding protein YcfA (HicA-like mRNA interferase family)